MSKVLNYQTSFEKIKQHIKSLVDLSTDSRLKLKVGTHKTLLMIKFFDIITVLAQVILIVSLISSPTVEATLITFLVCKYSV